MPLLTPSAFYATVYDIDLASLSERGIRALILDLDNTLIPWRGDEIPPKLKAWVEELKQGGFAACLVSNAGGTRAARMAETLGIPVVAPAGKPFKKGFLAALNVLGVAPDEAAVVGDQLFTDVAGGNRLKLYTILVNPISTKEFIGTRAVRMVERRIIRRPSE